MRNAKGFTLIELLIVVVIIGILAAIALPQFASTKEKSFDGAAKSDLRNLMTAQEAYFADNQQYETVTTIDDATPWLDDQGNALLVASQQVSLSTGSVATPAHFTARASHSGSSRGWCVTTDPTDVNAGKIQLEGAGTC